MYLQTEYGPIKIDFDPFKYKSAAGAAKALHKALCKFATEVYGQNPDIELFIDSPEQSVARGYGKSWRVCWESGPFEWAIPASSECRAKDYSWHTEPYYSFDLCFHQY